MIQPAIVYAWTPSRRIHCMSWYDLTNSSLGAGSAYTVESEALPRQAAAARAYSGMAVLYNKKFAPSHTHGSDGMVATRMTQVATTCSRVPTNTDTPANAYALLSLRKTSDIM